MTLDEQFQTFVRGLLTPDPAIAERHFRRWANAVDITDLDPRVLRMMPAFQVALQRHGLPTPFPGYVKKFERYWWLNQRWLERSARPLVQQFLDRGMPVVALKGLAVRTAIAHPDCRTMADIDLWIPEERVAEAMEVMLANGYEVAEDMRALWAADPKRYRRIQHALPMRHRALKMEVDLHWRLGGLISPGRSRQWLAEAAAAGPQVKGWPEGLRAMAGPALVRTVMANGYMDAWSSGIWMLDVQALTAGWTAEEWLAVRAGFVADDRLFMWNWACQTLLQHAFPLPAPVVWAGGAGPARRWRRMVYRGHWEDEARGLMAHRWVRPWRSAHRLTKLHAKGEGLGRRAVVFWSQWSAIRSERKSG